MKKILIVGNFSIDGGVVTWLNNLIKIINIDSRLIIISPGFCSRLDIYKHNNVHFYSINLLKPYNLSVLKQFNNIIKSNNIDTIISSELIFSILPLFLKKFYEFKLVIIVHGVSSDWKIKYLIINKILLLFYKYFTNIASFISVSDFIKFYLKNNGIDSERIYNPIELCNTNFTFPNKYYLKNIYYVGRIDFEKGPDIFYKISRKLSDSDFKFYMFGNGNYIENLRKLISQDNPHNFFLHKWSKIDKDFFSNCDAVLITSRSEALSYVALEAMNFGVPVIAINVGGLSEIIINNFNGYIFQTDCEVINFLRDIESGNLKWNPLLCMKNAQAFIRNNMDISLISKQYQLFLNK